MIDLTRKILVDSKKTKGMINGILLTRVIITNTFIVTFHPYSAQLLYFKIVFKRYDKLLFTTVCLRTVMLVFTN